MSTQQAAPVASPTFVEPSAAPPTMNILLYGPPGTGKTVGACSAPGPVLVINAEGPNALRYARSILGGDNNIREVKFTGADVLKQVYVHLHSGNGGEKTLVVDTVGEVYRVLLEELAGDGRASLQMYGDVNTKLERFVRSIRDLGVNVVLVAHEQVDDNEGVVTRRPSTGGKKLPEIVAAQVDIVAYTGVINPGEEGGEVRYVGQLIEGQGRRAKDRSGALTSEGPIRDLDLSEWIDTATTAMTGPPAQNTTAKESK